MVSFKTVREFAQTMMQNTVPFRSVSDVFETWWKNQPVARRTLPMKALAEAAFRKAWALQRSRWDFNFYWQWDKPVRYRSSSRHVLELLKEWLDIRDDDGDPPHGFYDLAEDFCRWWDRTMKRNFFAEPSSAMRTMALRAFQHGREQKNEIEFGWRTRSLARDAIARKQSNKAAA